MCVSRYVRNSGFLRELYLYTYMDTFMKHYAVGFGN